MPGCQSFRKHVTSAVLPAATSWKRDLEITLSPGFCGESAIPSDQTAPSLDIPIAGYTIRVFSGISQASPHWNSIQPPDNCFLGENYLRAVEQSPPEGVKPFYLVFFREDRPAGLAYLQLIDFRADQSLQSEVPEGLWGRMQAAVRKRALGILRFRLLQVGNMLLTGPRGYSFSTGQEEASAILAAALPVAGKYLERQTGKPIHAYVAKDVPINQQETTPWSEKGYWEFSFLPNMTFPIQPAWNSFDDYLAGLQSKYRVRARRAFRLLDGVETRELNAREIKLHGGTLYRLYEAVSASVEFNLAAIHPDYFSNLKNELGDSFHLVAYFLAGEMVGFYTTIENGEELEAHFIGFDQDINRGYQLYLNMLFDMIRMGIELRSGYISFARTAMEIKSSVGAVAEQFKCYIRHRSPLVNFAVGPLIRWLQPSPEFEARHPFR